MRIDTFYAFLKNKDSVLYQFGLYLRPEYFYVVQCSY